MRNSPFAGLTRPRTRRDLIASGVTWGRLRGPAWQQTTHGHYLPAGVDTTMVLQRILNAGVGMPAGAAVAGWASARVLGVEECDGLGLDGREVLAVPMALGDARVSATSAIDRWFDPLPEADVAEVDGIRFTEARRTTFDRMRRADDLREAVVAVDQMTHAELVSIEEMRSYVTAHAGWRGVEQARRALALCDPLARNGWETRLRMVWMLDAGLPRPMCNQPLFDRYENLLGYPDLLDADAGVVFEYDGAGHRRIGQHDRDNHREELFEEHGLVVARVTRLGFEHRDALVRRMRRTRERGLRRDRRRDAWTLEIPASWGAYDAREAFAAAIRRGEI